MLSETTTVVMAALGIGSAVVAVTAFIVAASIAAKRSQEELRELRKGFASVAVLAEQMRHLTSTVDRIATTADQLREHYDRLDRRIIALENGMQRVAMARGMVDPSREDP